MYSRSGYVATTPRLLMEWSFSVLKQIKIGMKRKLRLSFLLYGDVYPSETASEMRGRDLISSFKN